MAKIYPPILYKDEMLEEMKSWLSDCEWRDLDPEEIDELTPYEIISGVDRNYDGGIANFDFSCVELKAS